MDLIQFYDTETTGFIQSGLPDDHPSQPHLVQLGCVLYTAEGTEMAAVSLIVKPNGWTIPKQASDVHGITTEIAEACGVPLAIAVAAFVNMRHCAAEVVAHNKPFDDKVMAVQLARLKATVSKPAPDRATCTMHLAAPIVNIPPTAKMLRAGFNKPKAPTLTECYKYFFNEDLIGAHGAMTDAQACARVYFEIQKRTGATIAEATAKQFKEPATI